MVFYGKSPRPPVMLLHNQPQVPYEQHKGESKERARKICTEAICENNDTPVQT